MMNGNVDLEDLIGDIETNLVGRSVHFFEDVTSTNDVAKKLAEDGATDGTVVVAGKQSAGRGRYGRSWFSPAGSISMTVILRPDHEVATRVASAVGTVAACGAIELNTPLSPKIVWPNDVFVNGRKVAGVLAEASSYVLIGIGMNVNVKAREFPKELRKTATSLSEELGKKIEPSKLLGSIFLELDSLYTTIAVGETSVLEAEWRSHSATLGRQVVVSENGSSYEGRAIDVSVEEGLVMETAEGARKIFPPDTSTLVEHV
jgi:BirA family biotin operon repressor/biotin-[acetyl-CoA-carboxylase] ligase